MASPWRRVMAATALITALAACDGAGSGRPAPTPSSSTSGGADSSVAATIDVGRAPCAMASSATDVWISLLEDDVVTRIDPATNTVTARIPVMDQPCGLTFAGGRLWIGGGSGKVVELDPGTGTLGRTVELPGAEMWDVQQGFGSIWVTDRSKGQLIRIDTATATVTARITVGASAEGIGVTADSVWVASHKANAVVRVDPATNTVVASVALGAGPDWFAIAPNALWISLTDAREVVRVDPITNTVAVRVQVGPMPRDPAIVAGELWVADGSDGTLTRIDAVSGAIRDTTRVKTGTDTTGLWVVEPAAGHGWVLDFNGRNVYRLRTTPTTAVRDVSFTAADGTPLAGRLYGSGPTTVILSNMGDNDSGPWERFAPTLAGQGYTVLTYRFRYPSRANTFTTDMANATVSDLNGAIAYARQRGARAIVLVGASLGGMATAKVIGSTSPAAVVIIAAPDDLPAYGFRVSADEPSGTAPKLFIAAREDSTVPLVATQRLFDLASEPKELQAYDGGAHGLALLDTAVGQEVRQRVIAFVTTHAPA